MGVDWGGREVVLGHPGEVARFRLGLAVRVQGQTELREAERASK